MNKHSWGPRVLRGTRRSSKIRRKRLKRAERGKTHRHLGGKGWEKRRELQDLLRGPKSKKDLYKKGGNEGGMHVTLKTLTEGVGIACRGRIIGLKGGGRIQT